MDLGEIDESEWRWDGRGPCINGVIPDGHNVVQTELEARLRALIKNDGELYAYIKDDLAAKHVASRPVSGCPACLGEESEI